MTRGAALAGWAGRHRSGLGTLLIAGLVLLVIFGEQIGETPDEAMARSIRYCTWGIRTGVDRDARCNEMQQRFEQVGEHQPPGTQVAALMQSAEYRLIVGDAPGALAACQAAMRLYESMPDDGKARTQRDWDTQLCASLRHKFPQ